MIKSESEFITRMAGVMYNMSPRAFAIVTGCSLDEAIDLLSYLVATTVVNKMEEKLNEPPFS